MLHNVNFPCNYKKINIPSIKTMACVLKIQHTGHHFLYIFIYTNPRPWQFLYFLPLPQGHGSLRPTLGSALIGCVT